MIRRRNAGWALVAAGVVTAMSCGAALAAAPASPAATPKATASSTTTTPTTAGATSTGPATPAAAQPVPGVFAGDAQAFGVRMEVDEPLPAGPGDIPSVYGQVNSQENFATGTAAADLFGAVVGPKIADAPGDNQQYVPLPQATCLYPSQPNTVSQSYPTNGSNQQTVQSSATCAAGPTVTGTAYSGQIGGGAGITNATMLGKVNLTPDQLGISGVASAHETLGPDTTSGSALMSADAELQDFNIPNVLHVASVEATGYTKVTGRTGGASTSAAVTVSGLTIGGSTISIGPAGVQLGSNPPVPTSADAPVIAQFNQSAAGVGCNLTVLSNPKDYPQGTLFARPPLRDRVNPNGTDAGSTGAGALVRCAVPEALNPTNFSPLIIQIIFGFVGTEANASGQAANLANGSTPVTAGSSTPPATGPVSSPTGGTQSVTGGATEPSLSTQNNGTTSNAPTAPPPPSTPQATLPARVAEAAAVGSLVPIRGALEVVGLILALLFCFAGVGMVAPWRVTMAAADHPESGGRA